MKTNTYPDDMSKENQNRRHAGLEKSIIYNVYPQTYRDTNGDGIGDLPGIIEKLDYLQWLGVDILWLNPVHPSPFRDAGYDVTDYYDIADRYGTIEDFDRLIAAAQRKGIRIIMDLVIGHTSDQHPWFIESSQSTDNPKANRYIWSDRTFAHNGDAGFITGSSKREGKYHSNFFYFQPSLNFGFGRLDQAWQIPTDHPEVRELIEEIKNIIRFWLDRGVAGFRVDMAKSLVKQDDDERTAVRSLWRSFREWLDEDHPEALLISEWSEPEHSLSCGFDLDFLIHSGNQIYTHLLRSEEGSNVIPGSGHSFFRAAGKGDITAFMKPYEKLLKKSKETGGLISIPSGSHDLPRLSSGRTLDELKVFYAFQMSMPGVPTLYYGDEIGMRNLPWVENKEGGYNRTQARTPMQWNDEPNAGFSEPDVQELYLPVDPDGAGLSVESQKGKTESLLEFVRSLISLRKKYDSVFCKGTFKILHASSDDSVLAYTRTSPKEEALIMVNPSATEATAPIPLEDSSRWQTVLSSHPSLQEFPLSDQGEVTLPPTSYAIYHLEINGGPA